MHDNVYQELTRTVHFSNRSGVRATCPDCHVPHEWTDKIARKMQASKEVWGKIFGTIDTRRKFLDTRLELAEHEWARMKANDSLECRNCHSVGRDGPDEADRSAPPKSIRATCFPAKRPASTATRASPTSCRTWRAIDPRLEGAAGTAGQEDLGGRGSAGKARRLVSVPERGNSANSSTAIGSS